MELVLGNNYKLEISTITVDTLLTDIWLKYNDESLYYLNFNGIEISETDEHNVSIYHRSGWKTKDYIEKYGIITS